MSSRIVSPLTRAETSGYRETSRHADVMHFIEQLRQQNHPSLAVTSFGKSPENRDLPLLVLSAQGISTPEQARASELPIVLIINGIHAGEVEGKEASLMLARDLLASSMDDLLNHCILLIVPLFNPDGNDRISPTNRQLDLTKLEGQIGPVTGVGTRGNASGINLNRDYMKQEALEMRLLQTQVYQRWQPHLTLDCHATNGSIHRFALTYDVPHTIESGRSEPILFMREQMLPAVTQRLKQRTELDTFYYGNFQFDEQNTGNGWITYPHHPRFGTNYRGLTNRLDLLLETYSYLEFRDRVFTTYEFLVEVLQFVRERGDDMVQVVESSQRPPDRIAVQYRLEAFPEPVEILTRAPYALTGEPISVRVPHLARFVGTEIIDRPWAYAVSEAVAQHLQRHGLAVQRLNADCTAAVEVAYVEASNQPQASRAILEASTTTDRLLQAAYYPETHKLMAGTYLVETEQPLGAIAVYLCEACSDDNLVISGIISEPPPGAPFPILRVIESCKVN
ncbi:M14 family metallopeptidase [Phormidium tenue FACHB-886]|nr:M14 family metallopeptidase [Phormidium tenue FACHB-886]